MRWVAHSPSRRWHLRLALALGCAASLVGTPARAQQQAPGTPSTLSDALPTDAKADYDSAKLLYNDGDFNGALLKFSLAYKKSGDPRLLWNMAACEKSLRHYARALRLVRAYASDPSGRVSESERAEAH